MKKKIFGIAIYVLIIPLSFFIACNDDDDPPRGTGSGGTGGGSTTPACNDQFYCSGEASVTNTELVLTVLGDFSLLTIWTT